MKKKAKIYRMVSKSHLCPYGIKSLKLLQRKGYQVEDVHLTNRQETEKFKEKHDVKTTPQTFIEGERVGGLDDLIEYFNAFSIKQSGTTYQPIISIFLMACFLTLAFFIVRPIESSLRLFFTWTGFFMALLAVMKWRDLFSFTNQFITYDVLARRTLVYAYAYPILEGLVGVAMVAGIQTIAVPLVSITIGSIGAISVVKAVYIEKRDLHCACVGGDSKVPLGFISLSENMLMVVAGVLMIVDMYYI
jgi:glutaredoxin